MDLEDNGADALEPALSGYQRYAIYWAPAPRSGLAEAGAAWFGWDPETGREDPARAADARVQAPRRYGLHATLKAPFRLGGGATPGRLNRAIAELAAHLAPATAPGLELTSDLGFLALRPAGPCPEVDRVAAACVTELDVFRAPMSESERARRMTGDLIDPAALARLEQWGYPHVLDGFRFHVTLAGRLDALEARRTEEELRPVFAPHLEPIFTLDRLCLFGDPGGGEGFRLLRHYPLRG